VAERIAAEEEAAEQARIAEQERLAAEAAAEAARQEAEYTLVFSAIKATNVPNADKRGGSDPYCRFTLLELEDDTIETGRTQPIFNEPNPCWTHAVQLTVPNGASRSTPPTGQATRLVEKGPLVRVAIFDKDVTTSDDCIGQAEVRLAAGATSGEQQSVEMIDPTGKHAPFQMAFEWELRDEVPPASILVLSDIKVKSNLRDTDSKRGSGGSDAYVVFRLLECGDLHLQTQTPPQPNVVRPSWRESRTLSLPHGQSRPCLLQVYLWDDDKDDDDDPLATSDVRLGTRTDFRRGTIDVELRGVGRGNGDVTLQFDYELVDDVEQDAAQY